MAQVLRESEHCRKSYRLPVCDLQFVEADGFIRGILADVVKRFGQLVSEEDVIRLFGEDHDLEVRQGVVPAIEVAVGINEARLLVMRVCD